MEDNIGFIYILENEAMQGICKIGRTKNVDNRVESLNGTNIPFRFKCVFECKVRDYIKVEKAIHKILDKCRVQKDREFFYIEPEQVIPLLELLKIENSKRFSFKEMGIKEGEDLIYLHNPKIKAKVVDVDKRLVKRYGEDPCSLSELTEELLGYSSAPTPHWEYKGKTLQKIWNEYLANHNGD